MSITDIFENISKKEFTTSLIEELMMNVYNFHLDNIDIDRFGRNDSIIDSLNIRDKDINFFKSCFKDDFNRIEMLNSYFEGFRNLYYALDDEESSKLLIKIIAYKILGKERIKLPLNTKEFWEERDKLKLLIKDNTSIKIKFRDWIFSCYDLHNIGYPIILYNAPFLIQNTFITKQYEYRNKDIIIKAGEGDIVIDAGGCFGDTALYFAHEVGANGKVYTFEFIPVNLEIMMKNISLNPSLQERIKIIYNPLWDSSNIDLYYFEKGPASRVTEEKTSSDDHKIQTISIDNFVRKNNIKKIDFIKMDVEGAELKALKGAINTLKQFKPKLAISIYHNLDHFWSIPKFLLSLDLNYQFYLGHYTIHNEETILFAKVMP
jgi:FkbM family methyltransferase